LGAENVFISTRTLGASTREAYEAADRRLGEKADPNRVAEANKETR
jgi:hypothetical protein